ncbi:uncharacterized protein LOC144421048 [Styela clava]
MGNSFKFATLRALLCWLVAVFSICECEEILHCTSKSGCHFSHCDPVLSDWNKKGFNIEAYLERKEFPLTCKSMNSINTTINANVSHGRIAELEAQVEKLNRKQGEATKDNQEMKTKFHLLEQQVINLFKENKVLKDSIKQIKNSSIQNKTEVTTDEDGGMAAMNIEKPEMIEEPTTAQNCDITYNSKCYQAIVYNARNVTLSIAMSLCKDRLANIYDAIHYNLLQAHIRPMIPDGWGRIDVWTGMTYKNGKLLLSSGKPSSLPTEVRYPGTPYNHASWTSIVISVNRNPRRSQGIYNNPPSTPYYGVICES